MDKFNVLVVDDHDLFREGIKTLLRKIKNIQLAGEARNGTEAVEMYKKVRPQLVLLDISMPDINGIEVVKEIIAFDPLASIIILSMHDDEDYVSGCINAGVKGYVLKSESGTELKHAMELVLQGHNYFSNRAQDVMLSKIKQSDSKKKAVSDEAHITQREIEILNLIVQGMTSNEMAEKLFISIRTVETHRANIMRKLGVKNAVELVKEAIKLKLVQ